MHNLSMRCIAKKSYSLHSLGCKIQEHLCSSEATSESVLQTHPVSAVCGQTRSRAGPVRPDQHDKNMMSSGKKKKPHMFILAEGAIALPVTLSGRVLFAS